MSQKVGIIGLGEMGYPIATHIISSGRELYFYARRDEVIESLKNLGGTYLSSPEELGKTANIIILLVKTYEQCLDCLVGEHGILKTMYDATIIVASTIGEDEVKHISVLCAKNNITVLDAPISGGKQGAINGTLTVMVAGNTEMIHACEPILETFSSSIITVGEEIGNGQVVKSINQLLVTVHMVAAAEAMTLGEKSGIPLAALIEVITNSAGNSKIFESRGKSMMDMDFHKRSTLSIQDKDAKIAVDLARKYGAPSFLGTTCSQLYSIANSKYDSELDSSAILKLYKDLSI